MSEADALAGVAPETLLEMQRRMWLIRKFEESAARLVDSGELEGEVHSIYDPHVTKQGIAAGDGGFLMWALQLGIPRAKYHLLAGAPLTARQAADCGLINECLPRAEVMPRAMELARQFADGPGLAIRSTKRILNKVVEVLGAATLEYAGEKERVTLFSADFKEAVTASVEGRKPTFQNR